MTAHIPTGKNRLAFSTRTIHGGQSHDPLTGAVMVPIYATSTYGQQSPGVHKGFEYARSQNPTRFAFERAVADLESGSNAFAFASGMATTATVLELLDSGSHVVALDDLYGGTRRLFERVRKRSAGLSFTYLPFSHSDDLHPAVRPETKMIWIESPSNPLLKLVDLEAVAAFAKSRNIISVIDNTFASPWCQRPLELGFDIVVHSATKYLNGHSDVIGGVCVTASKAIAEKLGFLQNAIGSVPSPFDSFLVTRGLKTLAVRMERHCANARRVADFLRAHPRVSWVNYPGLADHPQHALVAKQMRQIDGAPGASGLLAFGVKGGLPAGVKFIEAAQFMSHLANIGDTRTLIIHPASTTHRQLDDAQQRAAGVLPDMVRMSVGIEHIDDILWDIDQALAAAGA